MSMTGKQIDSMISEVVSIQANQQLLMRSPSVQFARYCNTTKDVSLELPVPDTVGRGRSSHQLIRSMLYMGQLIRGNKQEQKKSDFLVELLETVTSLLDNLYLVTKFGIGKQSKWLQNISLHASKVWFVTLILSLRKIILNLLRLVRLKASVSMELAKCQMCAPSNKLRDLIIQRYRDEIDGVSKDINYELLELLGTLIDLGFVSIELFRWRVHPALEKLMGAISALMSIHRLTRR